MSRFYFPLLLLSFICAPRNVEAKVKIKIVEDVRDDLSGPMSGYYIKDGMAQTYKGMDSIWFAFSGINPDRTDAEKDEVIKKWDEKMKLFVQLAQSDLTLIGINVGSGMFLKESEGYSTTKGPYPSGKKPTKLNLKRFLQRYKASLESIFQNRDGTILLSQWNW